MPAIATTIRTTGANFVGLCRIATLMRAQGVEGSLVTLICDSGERYRNTYYEPRWLAAAAIDYAPYETMLERFLAGGEFSVSFEEASRSR